MAKFLKLKISKAVSRSFHSCRSKDPSTLPQHPVPSFSPNTQLIKVDHLLLSEEMIHRNNESLLISTHDDHVLGTQLTADGRCSSRNGEAPSDDSHTSRSILHEFKWQHVVETNDDTDQQCRMKISYSSISDDSDNNEVLAEKNKCRSSGKKKISSTSKTRLFMMMSTTSSSSSADESGINFTSEKANWDYYHDDIDSNEDEEDETKTLVSSSCKSCVDFPDDFSQELETIYKNTMTKHPKKIATTKGRVNNTRDMIMNKNGRRSSISTSTTSSDGELPPRLSELIPCSVEGKVKESFAILKKSEDPYEDFKSSMMEMILEKKMFEKNDLEQLLRCFLSINAKNYHGVIVEAFSEIWKTLFLPNHD